MIFAYFINLVKHVKIFSRHWCGFNSIDVQLSQMLQQTQSYYSTVLNTTKINNPATISGSQISLFLFPLKIISLLHTLPHSCHSESYLTSSKFPWSCLLKITHFYDFWFYLLNETVSLGKWKENLLLVTKFHALVFFPVNIPESLRNENNK